MRRYWFKNTAEALIEFKSKYSRAEVLETVYRYIFRNFTAFREIYSCEVYKAAGAKYWISPVLTRAGIPPE